MPKVPMYDVNKLRQLALERGLTVAALARKAGMPQATVQQIFSRGSGHPLSLRRIAEALDLQLTDIVIPKPMRSHKGGQMSEWNRPTWLPVHKWVAFRERFPIPQCLECGSEDNMTVDHIIPRDADGTDDLSNLQPLCLQCNVRKRTGADVRWSEPTYFDQDPALINARPFQNVPYSLITKAYPKLFRRPISQNSRVLMLMQATTGAGKTGGMIVAALAVNHETRLACGSAAPRVRRCLIITKEQSIRAQITRELRQELSQQWKIMDQPPVVEEFEGRSNITQIDRKPKFDIGVVCVQTLWELAASERAQVLNQFEVIHLDEPHWGFPNYIRDIVASAQYAITFGWTATPCTKEGRPLKDGSVLFGSYSYADAISRDGTLKYIPEPGREQEFERFFVEAEPTNYERHRGHRETRKDVRDEPDYPKGWPTVETVALGVVTKLIELDRVDLETQELAPHRRSDSIIDLIYPAHAMIVVEGIDMAERLEKFLNETFKSNRSRYPLERGWRAETVHSGDDNEDNPISAKKLHQEHDWFLYKRSSVHGVGSLQTSDQVAARVLIVIGMGRLGVSNWPCVVLGVAAQVTFRDAIQLTGRGVRSHAYRDENGRWHVPPAPLDSVVIISHLAYNNRATFLQAIEMIWNPDKFLENMPKIEDLYESDQHLQVKPEDDKPALSLYEKLRMICAIREAKRDNKPIEPEQIMESADILRSEPIITEAARYIQKSQHDPESEIRELIQPRRPQSQRRGRLRERGFILNEDLMDLEPDDETLIRYVRRECPEYLDGIRMKPREDWRYWIVPLYKKHIKDFYRYSNVSHGWDVESIRALWASEILRGFGRYWPQDKQTYQTLRLFVGRAMKDLIGTEEPVEKDGPFDNANYHAVLLNPSVAEDAKQWVRAKLIQNGYIPLLNPDAPPTKISRKMSWV